MNTTVEKQKKITADILLKRKNKIIVSAGNHSNSTQAQALAINIASLGYVFHPELMKVLETLSTQKLSALNERLVPQLSKMVGAHVKHKPLFRNFPEDVPNVIDVDKVIEHLSDTINFSRNFKFLTCGHLVYTDQADLTNMVDCPVCGSELEEHDLFSQKQKESGEEGMKFRVLTLGKEGDLFKLFKNLVSSKTSISETDKEDIATILTTHKDVIAEHFPDEIPHKEVLSYVCALVLAQLPSFDFLAGKIKTTTDVLRIAVAMSNGDVSLATPTKFSKFSKKERRFLLTLLEACPNKAEDMVRYKYEWIRIGEIIHPGSYALRFPESLIAFSMLRDGKKIETFNATTEDLISRKMIGKLSKHLAARPSEFGRRLDYMLSNAEESLKSSMVSFFSQKIARNIPTPTLLQIMSNFYIRSKDDKNIRIILPKGNLSKVKILEDNRKTIPTDLALSVIDAIETTLKERFATMDPLGKVYLDKNLSSYLIPANQRSASKALKTIVRGSQVSMSDETYVRMFLYWKEPAGYRTDIDLSAIMFDDEWNMKGQVSFTRLQDLDCHHSGDITSAPNGASEFIDINKSAVMAHGVRYVAMNIYSFTAQPFVELPECFAGIMGRKKPKSGEVYDAKTVKHKFDLTAESQTAIPLILDLYTNKMIWTDINIKTRGYHVESNTKTMKNVGQALARMVDFKTSLYHLLQLHVAARGELVETPEEAEVVFDEENVPFETERIMSEFLS